MKQIIIKVRCNIKGKKYDLGDEFKPKKEDMSLLCKLNEKGFVEPLTKEELLEISSSFFNTKKKRGKKDEL